MKIIEKILLLLLFVVFFNCSTKNNERKIIKNNDYELVISPNQKAVLVLFPCFPCDINHTKTEAKFLNDIEKEGITTLLLNYNQKLFLSDKEENDLAKQLNHIFDENNISKNNIYFGGFSSGGNVTVLLSNYLVKIKNTLQPKGIFVVDSPLDLEELYNGAKKDISENVNQSAVEEGKFIVDLFEKDLGNPTYNIDKYKEFSPYLISSNSTQNIEYLKNLKVRFYSEPDLDWQKEKRNRSYEDLNAYKLEKTEKALENLGAKNVTFIKTKNRGIRANGEKHPHTWNLVEKDSLVNWMID